MHSQPYSLVFHYVFTHQALRGGLFFFEKITETRFELHVR